METVTDKTPLEAWQQKIARTQRAAAGRGKHVASLAKKLKEVEHEQNTAAYAERILSGVLKGWKENDPGKYGPAYHFLDGTGRKAMVEEFLTPEECAAARKCIQITRLEYLMYAPCPNCGPEQKLPVIEEYHQTEDSHDGDTWMKRRLVACPDCNAVYQVGATIENDHRF